ncbi:MAG: hypothetical protein JWM68_3446 [Verrucomicrobiales bacterium]|nr:hypothetical protein [Verrucomicrobiales bacterium]
MTLYPMVRLVVRWLPILLGLVPFVSRADSPPPQAVSLTNNPAVANAIRSARDRLRNEQSKLSPAEFEREANTLGISNYVSRAVCEAFERNEFTNGFRLLEQFPQYIDRIQWSGQPLLLQAVLQNKKALVEGLLQRKANPDVRGQNNDIPVCRALDSQHWTTALQLVEAGADLTATNNWSATPLSLLINSWWRGQSDLQTRAELLEKMLERGADPFARVNGTDPRSILEAGIDRSDQFLCETLLTNKPNALRRTPGGDTALHIAARFGLTNEFDFLLASGFSIDQTNNEGLTALQMFVGNGAFVGDYNAVNWRSRSRIPIYSGPGLINAKSTSTSDFLLSRQATLDLFSAAGLGMTNMLAAMLQTNAAAANERDGLGRTPLHYAMFARDSAAATLLIRAGTDVNAVTTRPIRFVKNTSIPAGTTALQLAVHNSSTELMQLLLDSKARTVIPDADGNTPLHIAASQYVTNSIGLLLSRSVPLNITNNAGQTPLRRAVELSGSVAVVELLLKAGANVAISPDSRTLMHVAAERGRIDLLPTLLAQKLALEALDARRNTPFMQAVSSHQWSAFAFLHAEGANINAVDIQGDTALHGTARQQDDNVWHQIEGGYWDVKKRRWQSSPGVTGTALRCLIGWKILSPPAPLVSTNSSITQWMLEHGADPNATNLAGQTPLDLLCQQAWIPYGPEGTNRIISLLNAGAKVSLAAVTGKHLTSPSLALLLPRLGNLDAPRDEQGRTLLHWSVMGPSENYSQQNHLLGMLLTNGANPNLQDKNGFTPLHALIQAARTNSNFDLQSDISLLLTNHAQRNLPDDQGRTPLHLIAAGVPAGQTRLEDRLQQELVNGAWDYGARDKSGQTPLHLWATNEYGNYYVDQIFRTLVTNKTLLNITNNQGDTPLHVAVRAGRYQVVQALIQAGADISLRNKNGESPLFLATTFSKNNGIDYLVRPPGTDDRFFDTLSQRGEAAFVRWLEMEPKLCCITNAQGQTPLQIATERNLRSFVERLLKSGVTVDLLSAVRLKRQEDFMRLLPTAKPISRDLLFASVDFDNGDALVELVKAGGDVNATDANGLSLFHRASARKKSSTAEWLQAHGAKENFFDAIVRGDRNRIAEFVAGDPKLVNTLNTRQHSPLVRAVVSNQKEVVAFLLQHGAKVDSQIEQKWTAFHIAAARNFVEIGEMLLQAGADPNELASGGIAPMHIVAAFGRKEFLELLLRHNALVNIKVQEQGGHFANTPLHWAAHKGHVAIVKILLEHGADPLALNRQNQTVEELILKMPPNSLGFYSPGDAGYVKPLQNMNRAEILELLRAAGKPVK